MEDLKKKFDDKKSEIIDRKAALLESVNKCVKYKMSELVHIDRIPRRAIVALTSTHFTIFFTKKETFIRSDFGAYKGILKTPKC